MLMMTGNLFFYEVFGCWEALEGIKDEVKRTTFYSFLLSCVCTHTENVIQNVGARV